jgi:amino-acid N-acetyltransferase
VQDDLPCLLGMLREASLPDTGVSIGEFERHLLATGPTGEMLGGAGLELRGADALLRSLIVRPGRRGAGIGRSLVEAAEALARSQGIDTLYLLTLDQAAFFAGLGFVEQCREAAPPGIFGTGEFSSLCPASAVCLRKQLKPLPSSTSSSPERTA